MKISDTNLPRDARERVEAELRPGEELQWAGTYGKLPRGAISMMLIVDFIAVVLSVVVAVLSWRDSQSVTMLLICAAGGFGIPYLSYAKMRAYQRTVCMLTNHRVAWLQADKKGVLSLPLTENMIRRVVMKQGGSGDIVFACVEDDERCVFYNVPKVRELVSRITELSAGR